MKICLVFYPIMDMGGLTNNNNNLCAGLKELGHEVDTRVMLYREDHPRNGIAGGRGTICPATGLEHDQMRGYTWPRGCCVPYKGRALGPAIEYLNSYDLIIWQIPCPTMKKENFGNMDWIQLYRQCTAPQVAYIHDGNFPDGYPWLSLVAPYLKGIGCVNHAALNSAKQLSCKYSLTPSPQQMRPLPKIDKASFEARYPGFLSLQTFKGWKHVPELIAAIPYCQDMQMIVAGRGIDYHYLTSKEKCKWPGIWDAAIDHGMVYAGVMTNQQRDDTLSTLTCLVDPSWSKKYATIGGHYNRVTVEAIMCGAVPIVRPLGISTNLEGMGEIFKHGINCLAIPQDVTPQEYGRYLYEYCHLSYSDYLNLMGGGLGILKTWDRVRVAQTFLDLAEGKYEYEGVTAPHIHRATAEAIGEFFGG